jgi:hypothetical protein
MKIILTQSKCLSCKKGKLKSFSIEHLSDEKNVDYIGLDPNGNDLFCQECEAYYVFCYQCSDRLFEPDEIGDVPTKNPNLYLCKFLGHGDITIGDLYNYDKHKYYIESSELIKNNFCYHWKCQECRNYYDVTDK